MAERRMFSKRIISSARFLKMPISSQALYFHLGLNADDDGVVEAYNVIKATGCTEDDLRVLVAKNLVQVLNEDLVSYITDWNENNRIRPDRKIDSIYQNLLISINPDIDLIQKRPRVDAKKKIMDNQWTTNGQPMDGIGKDSIGKYSIDKINKKNNTCAKAHEKEVEELFKKLWDAYIRKEGKSQVSKKAKTEIYEIGYDRMMDCIDRYAKECTGREKRYILMGSTFFNGRYKDYLKEEPVIKKPQIDNRVKYDPDDEKNVADHPFEDGWRIDNDGYWVQTGKRS